MSTTEAGGKRRQRRDEVKQQLQDAMLEQAQRQAFRDLRIESLTEATGLSRSAFYFYYRDKHDLLMDAAARASEELFEQADAWWHGEGEPAELIRTALTGVAEVWLRHREIIRLATEVSTYDEEVREFWRGLVSRFVDATADHVEREQKVGTIDPAMHPKRTAEVLIWGAERTLYIFLAAGDRKPSRVVDSLTDTWMRALYGTGA